MNPLISVIVPVYNVEKYINRCIESIIYQSYENFEVILIDDGSTDQCPNICDKWSRKDERIKVVHKQNQGLGFARNSGIDAANGKYICFIDSDDFIEKNTFLNVINLINQSEPDLVMFGYKRINQNGQVVKETCPSTDERFYKGKENILNNIFPYVLAPNPKTGKDLGLSVSTCFCFFRVEILNSNGLRFVSERDIISEDIFFMVDFFNYIDSIAILNLALYNYCENVNSLSKSYKPDRFQKILYFYRALREKCISNKYDSEVLLRINALFFNNVISCIKNEVEALFKNGWVKSYKNIKRICDDELFNGNLEKYPKKFYSYSKKILAFSIIHRLYLLVIALSFIQIKRQKN